MKSTIFASVLIVIALAAPALSERGSGRIEPAPSAPCGVCEALPEHENPDMGDREGVPPSSGSSGRAISKPNRSTSF